MRALRRARRAGFDVAFYAPLAGSLFAQGGWQDSAGGAETQVHLIAQELARRGLRVALICFATPDGLPAQVGGVAIHSRPPWRVGTNPAGPLLEVAAIMRAIVAVPSAVYVQRSAGFETGVVALAVKLRRRRFIHSTASNADFDMERHEPKRRNRVLYHLGVRLADALVVQTADQVALCRRVFGRDSVRIPSIAEPAEERKGPGEAFLWVGRAAWYKGPLEFAALAEAMPQARFRMVVLKVAAGLDSTEEELRRVAERLPNLELLDGRPRADVLRLMDDAVCIVSTSAYEGMPNIFLEGWARGVPALTLNTDPDGVIEQYGIGAFAHGSAEQLVREAEKLWRTREDQRELAARCRRYIDAHSARSVGALWADVLR